MPLSCSFAKTFDPLWKARIYKNGKEIETVKSTPIYSVINGFWINEIESLCYNLHQLYSLPLLRLEKGKRR